jgi:hypothetical protein
MGPCSPMRVAADEVARTQRLQYDCQAISSHGATLSAQVSWRSHGPMWPYLSHCRWYRKGQGKGPGFEVKLKNELLRWARVVHSYNSMGPCSLTWVSADGIARAERLQHNCRTTSSHGPALSAQTPDDTTAWAHASPLGLPPMRL